MIHDDWDFTLSAVLHSVTVVVVTATGDGPDSKCPCRGLL